MAKRIRVSNQDFVHWHNHTEYSSLDGLAKMSNFVQLARKNGHKAVAITDHGNIGGFIKFLAECAAVKNKNGDPIPYDPIKGILGCEFYFCRKQEWQKKDEAAQRGGFQPDGRKGNRHLNLYAMNWKGYQNLCALTQASWVDGYYYKDPRIDLDLLEKHSEGLMCGTACLSSVINANLLHDRYDKAKKFLGILYDLLDGNVYVDLMYHGISAERNIIVDQLKLAKEFNILPLATNDCHYLYKSQAKSHEVLMCINTSNCLTNPNHMKFPYDEFYFKSAEEMSRIFGHVPQVLFNTLDLAERIDTNDIVNHLFGGMRLPKFELPEGFTDPFVFLVHLAKEGMKRLGWDKSKKHLEALKKELQDVKIAKENNNYDFATYFLIVWDYVNHARSKGIVTGCGRGSGYASVLLRCLGISYGPDPLEYGLLWERFLGFDSRRVILKKDFGFPEKKIVPLIDNTEEEDLEEEREVEDDFGGTDRY